MKTKHTIFLILFLLSCCGSAFADRRLERAEVLQILEKLTSQKRKTWITAGTIEAMHEEYRAPETIDATTVRVKVDKEIKRYQHSENKRELTQELQKMKLDAIPFNARYEVSNEYLMNSTVTVKFDGDRFYWEINIDSRTDSVRPDKDLEGNFMTDQFDLRWNARRIFVWDGEKYTTYFLPGNYAIVDATNITPHVVNGPLTAGIIPWGYGYYTYENLSAVDSYGVEKYIDGRRQIHLALNNPDGSKMLFVMDPLKEYSLISCLITGYGDVIVSKNYSNYQLVTGNWIPLVVLIERYEAGSDRLLASDLWEITNIDANIPESYNFDVVYENDALVEHFAFSDQTPQIYRYSRVTNTDVLLSERLAFAANKGLQPQNCATASLKYVIGRLDKDVTDQELATLVSEIDDTTNLYQMKLFTQRKGLYCKAVKTDITALENISDCEIILHIPGKGHFVVVSEIGNEFISVVDLSDNKFYYRVDLDFFSMDWTEGTALLISNNPIEGDYSEIDARELVNIKGALGYDCNVQRQTYDVVFCEYVGDDCGGSFRIFYPRWGCGLAESGSCSQAPMVRYKKTPCIEDLQNPEFCNVDPEGVWTYYFMMACK